MAHDLIERARWIERHVLPCEPGLRRYLAIRRLPQGLEIEDVIQESYARLAKLDRVDDIRNPRFYFFQVARSIILAHIRRAKIVSIESVEDIEQFRLPVTDVTPEIHASDREQLTRILTAIARLPEPGRNAFIMRIIHGLPHKEIGRRLGMSDNAVQKNVAKSLKLLMSAFGEGGFQGHDASKTGNPMHKRQHEQAGQSE